jgi:hypothetical protein
VEKEGKKSSGLHVYRASKTRAEQAAWAFIEANKDKIKFDLVTILPVLVDHNISLLSGPRSDVSMFF